MKSSTAPDNMVMQNLRALTLTYDVRIIREREISNAPQSCLFGMDIILQRGNFFTPLTLR